MGRYADVELVQNRAGCIVKPGLSQHRQASLFRIGVALVEVGLERGAHDRRTAPQCITIDLSEFSVGAAFQNANLNGRRIVAQARFEAYRISSR
jgi:hypothetical protein